MLDVNTDVKKKKKKKKDDKDEERKQRKYKEIIVLHNRSKCRFIGIWVHRFVRESDPMGDQPLFIVEL